MEHPLDELENPTHSRHQRREWRFERFGWTAFLLIIAAGLLGFLGPGPLTSEKRTSDDGSLTIEYQAVEHNAAPGVCVVRARSPADATTLRLLVSRSFCDHVTAESIVPAPLSTEARGDDIAYTFAVQASSEVVVRYRYEYDRFDVFDHRVAVEGGSPVRFRQYVLP
jgi:hypothetical protein